MIPGYGSGRGNERGCPGKPSVPIKGINRALRRVFMRSHVTIGDGRVVDIRKYL